MISNTRLINADTTAFIKTLPDNSIDLIATDPPYFRVKSCDWDNQWKTEAEYLEWLDSLLVEFWRVLKPNGSLYMFCGSRLASDTELLVRQRFDVLSHIVWAKPSGPWKRQNKESLRAFFPATERVIFAGHYAGPLQPKADGYAVKCVELKQNVLKPLIDYFKAARQSLGVSAKDINAATGTQMTSHWFTESQWQLPSESQYHALQVLFDRIANEKHQAGGLERPHHELVREYRALNREYLDLCQEYKSLRRTFTVSSAVPYTDVWSYAPVAYYPNKHPCEKPAEMMEHIISASSRPGDVVADFFMGSGSTIKAAIKLGRIGLGVELEPERFEQTVHEINVKKESLEEP